jgi:hypothetical protein
MPQIVADPPRPPVEICSTELEFSDLNHLVLILSCSEARCAHSRHVDPFAGTTVWNQNGYFFKNRRAGKEKMGDICPACC